MQTILDIVTDTWLVTRQMAPYLLFGFLLAGFLSVFISPGTVERHLGGRGPWQSIKASLLGVPLPLCSCSVVPVSASLYRHGAGRGATVSFLASTPQTGVDSIAITWSLLGPLVVVFRIVAAFVSGILAGIGVELLPKPPDTEEPEQRCSCCSGEAEDRTRLHRALRYGLITLPSDVGRSLLLGLLIAGVLTAVIPPDALSGSIGSGVPAMLLMMVIAIPIYTCSSGSVPVALGLIHAGVSPGAALVFLISGPATNAATVVTITKLLGRWAVATYLVVIAATALVSGMVLDAVLSEDTNWKQAMHHHEGALGVLSTLSAIALLVLLLPSLKELIPMRFRPLAKTSQAEESPHQR